MHRKTFGVSIPRNHILETRLDLELFARKRIASRYCCFCNGAFLLNISNENKQKVLHKKLILFHL
ncbi:MAG: hypothetical protein CVU43_05500 [Chloroflexi bacterium HGW-Chloroflexi-5]|nr:MAG: hypothetical protein CVU43_05500 [Chloroflexi bacterium HGW-Chloroflexi-5]